MNILNYYYTFILYQYQIILNNHKHFEMINIQFIDNYTISKVS